MADTVAIMRSFQGYLNKQDRFVDRIRVISLDDDSEIISFELSQNSDGSSFTVLTSIALKKNMTDFPSIDFHDAGQISIYTGCTAICGRHDKIIEYKISNRNGEFWVVGYTEITTDRLNAEVKICDVNLLNQKAEIGIIDSQTNVLIHHDSKILLKDLNENYEPEICFNSQ
jgi:hypothetical protein